MWTQPHWQAGQGSSLYPDNQGHLEGQAHLHVPHETRRIKMSNQTPPLRFRKAVLGGLAPSLCASPGRLSVRGWSRGDQQACREPDPSPTSLAGQPEPQSWGSNDHGPRKR